MSLPGGRGTAAGRGLRLPEDPLTDPLGTAGDVEDPALMAAPAHARPAMSYRHPARRAPPRSTRPQPTGANPHRRYREHGCTTRSLSLTPNPFLTGYVVLDLGSHLKI